jgi:acetyl-CoA carboxylase biotin carboxylase subunit
VIVHAPTREAAIERMDRYLAEFNVEGITTTIPFQRRVITHRSFAAAEVTTTWVENELLRETAETA